MKLQVRFIVQYMKYHKNQEEEIPLKDPTAIHLKQHSIVNKLYPYIR